MIISSLLAFKNSKAIFYVVIQQQALVRTGTVKKQHAITSKQTSAKKRKITYAKYRESNFQMHNGPKNTLCSIPVIFNLFKVADPKIMQFVVADPTQINTSGHDFRIVIESNLSKNQRLPSPGKPFCYCLPKANHLRI